MQLLGLIYNNVSSTNFGWYVVIIIIQRGKYE